MKYDLTKPCPHCPFRLDVPAYLRGGRAQEIARTLAEGGNLPCHVTTVDVEDDEGVGDRMATEDSQVCAGSMIAMENGPGGPNQNMRIAERLGIYDPSKLNPGSIPVAQSLDQFVRHHAGEDEEIEEFEPCSVAGAGCLAPAGYLVGGHVVPETNREETSTCTECGEAVCDACMDEHMEDHEEEAELYGLATTDQEDT